MINGSKISVHRFIATTLFRMVKEWPHSSGNNEWPLNYRDWRLKASLKLLWDIKILTQLLWDVKTNAIWNKIRKNSIIQSTCYKRLRYFITKFLSRYLFLWRYELANSFRLFRLHKFFLQMIIYIYIYILLLGLHNL